MPEPSSRDFRLCRVLDVTPAAAGARLRIRMEHDDHDPARAWSWCELEVALPDHLAVPEPGATGSIVLRSRVVEARESELEGVYSCKLQPASRQPTYGYERAREGFYSGLIERDAVEEAELLFHMGSGLTSYVELADEEVADPEELETGTWWELRFEEPHGVLAFEPSTARSEPDGTENGAPSPARRSPGRLARWFGRG